VQFVQVNSAVPQVPQSTVTVVYRRSQTAGHTNVLAIGWNDSTSSIASVTDSAGNAYRVAAPVARGRGLSQAIYYATNIKSAGARANRVAVTFTQPVAFPDIRILEYGGLDASNPFDGAMSSSGNGAVATTGNVMTHVPNELLVGAGMTTGAFRPANDGFATRVITRPDADIVADRMATSTGSYAVTAPVSGDWLMQIATFRAKTQ
jgi:hypothetical protein